MANSEDYLDGLLNSISKAKTDVDMASRREQMEQEEKIRRRTQVAPDDDFMSAQGLYDYEPRRTKRENLKRAFSESAFLEDFENEFELEMSDEDEDAFLADFEKSLREIREEEGESVEDPSASSHMEEKSSRGGDEPAPFFGGLDQESGSDDQEPVDALMENIASIVSEAKQKAQDDVISEGLGADEMPEIPEELMPEQKPKSSDGEEVGDMDFADNLLGEADRMAAQSRGTGIAGDDFLQPEFEPDEHDGAILTEEGEDGEITLLDPTVDGDDLLSMLSSGEDGDLLDIGDLLSADEGGQELSEAREAYEEGAAAAEEGLDDDTLSLDDFDEEENKVGILAKILGAITGIFSKFGKKDEEGEGEDPVVDPTAEELSAESDDILAEFAGEEAAAEAPAEEPKKKAKKEKPKKEKKEKPKKEKKPPKEKKPKEPDNSPKVPLKVIIVFLVLAASIIAFVLVVQNLLPQKTVNRNAKTAFANKEYFKSYTILDETNVSGDSEVLLLNKAKIMAQMELRYKGYEAGMKQQRYLYALDSLIIGFHFYEYYADKAAELEITDIYDELGSKFESALSDQYGLTAEDARELFSIDSRKVYTRSLKQIVRDLGLVSKGE